MQLQLNLSNNLIKSWKPTVSEDPPPTDPLLCWRLDPIALGRKKSNLICVNERSLFSFVITDLAGKKPVQIQQCFLNELQVRLRELHFPERARDLFQNLPVLFGKTGSRKIIGCVTDMKKGYQIQYQYADSHEEMEFRVNDTSYSCMDFPSPKMAFMALRKPFAETDPAFTRLSVPKEFVYAARQALKPWPNGLFSFDVDRSVGGMVDAYLSSLELTELGARLLAGPDCEWGLRPGNMDCLRFFYSEVVRALDLGGSD